MAWTETTSLTFSARHDEADSSYSEGILDGLERLSLKLEDRFERVPGGITVVVHPNGAWLNFAHPFLPLVRWSSTPAGRRYLSGWVMTGEIHVLGEGALTRRAAGDASFEALRGTAERLYAQLVIAANNERMPPPWSPSNFRRYLEWAWLVEGSAQHFARQVDLFRPAVIRRLKEGSRPSFPPSRRDATILGGTIFDLLEEYRGGGACELLVARLRKSGPITNLEAAFDLRIREVEGMWRDYLREVSDRRVETEGPLAEVSGDAFDESTGQDEP